jgi:cytochrome P450
MSCTFAWLAQHPDELQRLVDDPTLIPAAVEEIMRYESPVPSGMRYADDEIDLGDGLVIHKGEAMHPIWAAGNVDPNAHPDPLTVDFSRRPNHIVFASGTHRCLGSHLARLEMRLAVEEMLKRIPKFSIASDEKLVYDNVAVRNVVYLPIVFEPSTTS